MATRKDINVSENYVVHHELYASFMYVLCILKSWKVGQNRII